MSGNRELTHRLEKSPVFGYVALVRLLLCCMASLAFSVVSTLTAAGTALAQDTPMAAAAAQIASAIAASKETSVIVFDFSGPEGRVTVLGQQLASEFNAALEKSATSFHVEDRSLITDAVRQYRCAPKFVVNPETTLTIAAGIQVKAFVTGQVSVKGDKASVLISAYRVPDGMGIRGYRIAWPLNQQMRGLLDKNLADVPPPSNLEDMPEAGQKRYSVPSCTNCPMPHFDDLVREGMRGVVELQVVVLQDGSIGDMRVLRGICPDVNQRVIDAVKQWKLRPAKGPDGNPADVTEHIEVKMQLH
jgi:TonB family protein